MPGWRPCLGGVRAEAASMPRRLPWLGGVHARLGMARVRVRQRSTLTTLFRLAEWSGPMTHQVVTKVPIRAGPSSRSGQPRSLRDGADVLQLDDAVPVVAK